MMDYNLCLQLIKNNYTAILKDNLAGIYVHGSVAFGCFDWSRSDIDYIVVVNTPLSHEDKGKLIQETSSINLSAPPKGLEMSVVLKEHCMNFIYPTPYELHFSNSHCDTASGADKDLAAHFTVIKHTGMALCGEPIDSVFGDVPEADYYDSIKADIEDAGTGISRNQIYYVLNLCRVLAYKQDGLILSKETGGIWGMKNITGRYSGIIKTALKYAEADNDLLSEFYEHMLRLID
jgi:streptomycin 3"-adenylyltransferase